MPTVFGGIINSLFHMQVLHSASSCFRFRRPGGHFICLSSDDEKPRLSLSPGCPFPFACGPTDGWWSGSPWQVWALELQDLMIHSCTEPLCCRLHRDRGACDTELRHAGALCPAEDAVLTSPHQASVSTRVGAHDSSLLSCHDGCEKRQK